MRRRHQHKIRFGDLVAQAYDHAEEVTHSEKLASQLAAREVLATLERAARHDLVHALEEAEGAFDGESGRPAGDRPRLLPAA